MNREQLLKQKVGHVARAKAIAAELSAKDCDLTAEQKVKREAEADKCIADAKAVDEQIKALDAADEAAARRASDLTALEICTGRNTSADKPGENHVEVKAPEFTKDPMKGFATPRAFFQQAMREDPKNPVDDRMKYLSTARLEYRATAGSDEHKVADDSSLGFLVPEGMSPDLLTTPQASNPLAGKLRPVPMDSPSIKVNYRVDKDRSSSVSGGLAVSRSAETASKSASQMRIGRLRMEATSLFGFAYATEELLADSPRSVAALLAAGFGEEFASIELQETLFGTGTGEPLGFLHADNASLIGVSKETSQVADTIVAMNIIKMTARCWNYNDAIWLYNPTCYPALKTMYIAAGTAGVSLPMWDTIPTVVNGDVRTVDTLNGRPAFATDKMKAVGDKGDICLVVPSEILSGTYQPLETAESIHVRFSNHERAFKFWKRDDKRPWWATALTPENGDTRSPFVTLNARA